MMKKELSFNACLAQLKEQLHKMLSENSPNKYGEINIKKSARNINDDVSFIMDEYEENFYKVKLDKKTELRVGRFLMQIDESKNEKNPYVISSSNTLKSFLADDSVIPKIENLHIYSLYLNYIGWYHFMDVLNEKIQKDVLDIKTSPVSVELQSDSFFDKLLKGSKSYYKQRFEQLDISEIIIPKWKKEAISTEVKLDGENEETSLLNGVEKLWERKNKNCLIVGEGGMGKTYSLITIWKHFLIKKEPTQIIPIYISLNRYNDADEDQKKSYISNYILKNYLKIRVITKEVETEFWDIMLSNNEVADTKTPKIILLLDGFNEITTNSIALRKDLDDWWFSKMKNTQIIITSRYDNRFNNRWETLHKITLQPLSRKAIEVYLNKTKIDFPKEEEVFKLLSNPMMLTLYCSSNKNINKHSSSSEFDFKPLFTSQGELMWNFFESQLAKLFDTNLYDDQEYKYLSFLLKHLIPHIGFMMEENGQYNISESKLVKIIDKGCISLFTEDFADTFPRYRGYLSKFDLGLKPFPENNERFKLISEILCEKLQILNKENYNYEFIHQNFRDFSASVHIVNDLEISNPKGIVSETLQNKPLPSYITKFVGEIEGEHKKNVVLKKNFGK